MYQLTMNPNLDKDNLPYLFKRALECYRNKQGLLDLMKSLPQDMIEKISEFDKEEESDLSHQLFIVSIYLKAFNNDDFGEISYAEDELIHITNKLQVVAILEGLRRAGLLDYNYEKWDTGKYTISLEYENILKWIRDSAKYNLTPRMNTLIKNLMREDYMKNYEDKE